MGRRVQIYSHWQATSGRFLHLWRKGLFFHPYFHTMKKTFSLLFLLAAFCFAQPAVAQNVEGNGVVKTETRPVGSFTGLEVSGGFNIILTQGSQESLKLEADENILPVLTSEVRNGVLQIKPSQGIRNAKSLKIYLTVRDLRSISLSGGMKVSSTNTLKSSVLKLDLSGGMNINLALQVKELEADVSGGSKITLTGQAERARLEMSGAIKLAATELKTDYLTLNASGTSSLEVNAAKELNVDTSGIVKVAYKGTPKVHHSGMGKVRPI